MAGDTKKMNNEACRKAFEEVVRAPYDNNGAIAFANDAAETKIHTTLWMQAYACFIVYNLRPVLTVEKIKEILNETASEWSEGFGEYSSPKTDLEDDQARAIRDAMEAKGER